jgi:ketosteroid isomerase-like protein
VPGVQAEELAMTDEATLTTLNQQYVDSFMKADVDWYDRHLADDFVCIESNGSKLDKATFLAQTAEGPGVQSYHLDEAQIRIFGDVALVHGKGTFVRLDGSKGQSRYTDVYAKFTGGWKTVSAQITHSNL